MYICRREEVNELRHYYYFQEAYFYIRKYFLYREAYLYIRKHPSIYNDITN